MRRLAPIVAALAALAGAVDLGGAGSAPVRVRPPQFNATESCLRRAEQRSAFWFRASDGTRLAGVMLGKGRKGVALAHQGSGNLCNWFPYARTLARSGFRVLAFDFREYGASDIPRSNANLNRFDLDLVAAVGVLRKRGATSVAVAGGSLGAGTAVAVAADLQPRVQAVVSLSSPESLFDVDITAAAARLQVPALFVGAEDDDFFADAARSLYEHSSAPDKQLIVLEHGGHGTALLRLPVMRDALIQFFRAHLS